MKIASINSKMVVVAAQSDAIEIVKQLGWAIDMQLADVVVVQDEHFDAAVQAMVDTGAGIMQRMIKRVGNEWVSVKKSPPPAITEAPDAE